MLVGQRRDRLLALSPYPVAVDRDCAPARHGRRCATCRCSLTLISMVVPARLRAFGIPSSRRGRCSASPPLPLVGSLGDRYGIRTGIAAAHPGVPHRRRHHRLGVGHGRARHPRRPRRVDGRRGGATGPRARAATRWSSAATSTSPTTARRCSSTSTSTSRRASSSRSLGTNGAGKSTLLRAICGIQEASNGAIFLDGQDITHRPPHENAAGRHRVHARRARRLPERSRWPRTCAPRRGCTAQDDEYVKARTEEVLDFFPVLRERLDAAGRQPVGRRAADGRPRPGVPHEAPPADDRRALARSGARGRRAAARHRRARSTPRAPRSCSSSSRSTSPSRSPTAPCSWRRARSASTARPPSCSAAATSSARCSWAAPAGRRRRPFIAAARVAARAGRQPSIERVLDVERRRRSPSAGTGRSTASTCTSTAGEVVGIIGPNGAGKTTLFDVDLRLRRHPTRARWRIAGIDVAGLGPDARARLGLGRSFQNARLFPALTVRENIAVALEQRIAVRSAARRGRVAAGGAQVASAGSSRRVEYLIDLLNLEAYADKFVGELSTGTRRMVDIACVMAAEPKSAPARRAVVRSGPGRDRGRSARSCAVWRRTPAAACSSSSTTSR